MSSLSYLNMLSTPTDATNLMASLRATTWAIGGVPASNFQGASFNVKLL